MEDQKNHFENTEEIVEKHDVAEGAPTPEPGGKAEETMPEPVTVQEEKQSGTSDGGGSYSYGERAREGVPYQTRNAEYQEEMDTTPLTMGDWLLTLLAGFIPCCGGIILYCYWAFARRGNLHRRNFCRAALIVEAVLIVLLIVFLILIAVIGSVSYSNMPGEYYYYGY